MMKKLKKKWSERMGEKVYTQVCIKKETLASLKELKARYQFESGEFKTYSTLIEMLIQKARSIDGIETGATGLPNVNAL